MIQVTEDTIKDLFEGKDVILVGNSVEMMNHKLGNYIDSFDTVVRFGKAIEANEKEQLAVGKKIDVWLTGEFRSHMLNKPEFARMIDNVPILYNNARMKMHIEYPKHELAKGSYDIFSDDEIREWYDKYNVDYTNPDAKRFSAGIWAILFMVEKVKTYKSLTIVGFDFFKKSTSKRRGGNFDPCSWYRYILNATEEVHSHEMETAITRKYESEGKLTWKILSDLNAETCDDTVFGRF